MALPLTEDQQQLRDTMRGWFSEKYPLTVVRSVFEGTRAPIALAELGELGLADAFTFDDGGWGLRELGIVAFECGYALAPAQLHLTLLSAQRDCASSLSMTCNGGSHAITFGNPSAQPMIDRTQCYSVSVSGETAALPRDGQHAMRALLANEAAGVCARVIEMTREYVATRKQFGKPIGTFQAVQHKLAESFMLAESLRTTAEFAAWAGSHSPEQFAFSASAAATLASEIAPKVAESCLQLHGGIGFTWEHDLHLFLRRAKLLQSILRTDSHAVTELLTGAGGAN